MELLYDDDLVEAVVSLTADGRRPGVASLQIHRFHFERERIYSTLDPDERADAFSRLYLRWFQHWGLDRPLKDALAVFPELEPALSVLAFRKGRTRSEEGAEMYVNASGHRNGVVALRAMQFERDEMLVPWLRRELMHLADMVDPRFGYSPAIPGGESSLGQHRPVLERYRLLWNISIEGRLERRFGSPQKKFYQDQFDRAFAFWTEEKRRETFDSFWNDVSPKHEGLMSTALDPRQSMNSDRPMPGAACPLCGFSTFDWAKFSEVHPRTIKAIRTEFPDWNLKQGVCSRCAEIYRSASFELPATLFMDSKNRR
jgi:hypothetical protein